MKTIFLALIALCINAFLYATNSISTKSKGCNLTINTPKDGELRKHAFAKANSVNSLISKETLHETVSPFIKVALLLDTSNSMDGLIDQAKAQLWELVNELSYARCGNDITPSLEIALYEYGNDRLNAREGYIRQVSGFTNDLDDISGKLFELSTNGGSEYCGKVIQTTLNQLNWGEKPNDLNLIFIAGNEPFNQGPVNYMDAAGNACAKDVTVNTIFCGNYNEGARTHWKKGATLTHGDYIAIDHDKKTVHMPSPYDDRILEKNEKLNKTYVQYGSLGKTKALAQATQDSNASQYGQANAVKRAVSKSSHFYKNSSWDLVDAIEEEQVQLEELDDTALPQELRGKTTHEIKQYIAAKQKEREAIQKEIATLNKKRLEYLATQQKSSDNQLRNAMLDAIKKQATKKSYSWE